MSLVGMSNIFVGMSNKWSRKGLVWIGDIYTQGCSITGLVHML